MSKLRFVRKASRDYPESGIKKGDSFWWWYGKRPSGGRAKPVRSRNQPLSTNPFENKLLQMKKDLSGLSGDPSCVGRLEAVSAGLHVLAEDFQAKIGNLQEAFPGGSPQETLLQSRWNTCERIAGEIERIAQEITFDEGTEEETRAAIEAIDWTC